MIKFVDKEWREDLLNTKARLDKRTVELLTNGPKSFMQSLFIIRFFPHSLALVNMF